MRHPRPMTEPDPKIERFLRRNLRTVARQGGMTHPSSVELMHGSFVGLKRNNELPEFDELRVWAESEGLAEEDVLRLHGVLLAVDHGERNFGQLTSKAQAEDLIVQMTRDEGLVARSALFLLLYGPFCNFNGHSRADRDIFEDPWIITGFAERDFRYLLDALDEQIPRSETRNAL